MYNSSQMCAFIDFKNKHVPNMCYNWYHVEIEQSIKAVSSTSLVFAIDKSCTLLCENFMSTGISIMTSERHESFMQID